jgi:hypothetical protein
LQIFQIKLIYYYIHIVKHNYTIIMSENSYIFTPPFSNSDLIVELISMMDIPIPDKYKLTNIQDGKITINDDEELIKTLESMRYHGVKYIPTEVLWYISTMENDRIDLSHFEDFLTDHFSKLNNDTFVGYLIGTHEQSNFNLFKMLLKSAAETNGKYNYKKFNFDEMFSYFSREEILYTLNTYPIESKKYFDEKSIPYQGMVRFYSLLLERDMFDIFKILVEQIGTTICLSSAQHIVERGNIIFIKYVCEYDKKGLIPVCTRQNPNTHSQRFVAHAITNGNIEVMKYVIEEHNNNIISERNVHYISMFDDFNIVKYIINKYNKPFTEAHKKEILSISVLRGNLEIIKYLYGKGCRFPTWMYIKHFDYNLSNVKFDIYKKAKECVDWVFAQN